MYKKYLLIVQVEVLTDNEITSKKIGAKLIRAIYDKVSNLQLFGLNHQQNLKVTRVLNPNDIEKLSNSINSKGELDLNSECSTMEGTINQIAGVEIMKEKSYGGTD